ncbi:hypothetical protein DCO48_16270 [Pseudomonas sp. SDI]|nr:hypothetical protein DCO48_16270 [Pseudomonas sp. SDI]
MGVLQAWRVEEKNERAESQRERRGAGSNGGGTAKRRAWKDISITIVVVNWAGRCTTLRQPWLAGLMPVVR